MSTLLAVFDHVAVLAPPGFTSGGLGGNVILAASDRPFDLAALAARVDARGGSEEIVAGAEFARDAPILTDDHAPVDQWLSRDRRDG